MAIGEVLREARQQLGITQEQVGGIAYISPKTVSAYETGRRAVTPEVMEVLVKQLDHPRLCMEAAATITGGAYCSPWLDGERVDLHRVSVWAKVLEELEEAMRAVGAVCLVNHPQTDDCEAMQRVQESIMQLLDARVAVDHYVAVICRDFDLSISAVYQAHRRKLESRGYVKPRQKKAATKAVR